MFKKIIMAVALIVMMSSASMALTYGVGVKNIIANGTGVDLVIKGLLPLNLDLTIGGIYNDSANYLATASVVGPSGLGLDVIYNGITTNYVANAILEKEISIKDGLALVFAVDLATYNSVTQKITGLQGGSIGFRNYL